MALPEVTTNILDPGLGVIPANPGRTQVKAGVCSKGTPNTLYSAGNVQAARDAIGYGPLLEAAAKVLNDAGGPVLLLPILPSSYGTVTSSFTLTGSATATVVGSKGPREVIKVKIVLGGALATMTFQVALGSGAYGATIASAATPTVYQVVGDYLTTLSFAAGTYITGDIYTLNLDGTVTRTGTGPATALDGSTHSPVDAYTVWVQVMTAGALGAGAFRYSLDGGNTYSAQITLPSGGKYPIPETGVVLTFSGTFVADDLYVGTATAPGYSTGDVTTALTALLLDPTEWGFVHVVGTPASAAAAASLATVVDTQMTAAESAFRYVHAVTECPQTESDATIKTAFASFASKRVGIACGDAGVVSPITGRIDRRNCAWVYTARLSKTKLSEHPGKVKLGALPGVRSLYRDEFATPSLDAAGFITLRSLIGRKGYFVTRGRIMAAAGSDFQTVMNRRVMDRVCAVARDGYLTSLNDDVRIDPDTGYIDERDAQQIDNRVSGQLEAALIDEDEISSVTAQISRTDNLLSTSTANCEVAVVPKGYLEAIRTNLGFVNPVLASRAA